jgi:hypothetical protein
MTSFLRALPEVVSVDYAEFGRLTEVEVDGGARVGETRELRFRLAAVTPGFFENLRIPVLNGRSFAATDNEGSQPVAIVNESAARRFFLGRNPVGTQVALFDSTKGTRDQAVIVGVVRDSKFVDGITREATPTFFRPTGQIPGRQAWMGVRLRQLKPQTVTTIREHVTLVTGRRTRPDEIKTAQAQIAGQVRQPRFNATVLLSFALFGLLLAAMGIYGIVAQAMVTRTRELGIRVALGATGPSVMTLVSREAGGLATMGILAGVVASFAFTRVLKSFVFMTSTTDPTVLIAASAVITVVAFCACLIPARKAALADPMLAMRA